MGEGEGADVGMAELLAALSLGIDLGFGQPMEHVLRQCRIALRIAEHLDLDEDDRAAVYYAALLVNVGCHTDAYEQAQWFGDDIALKATKYEYEPMSLGDIAATIRLLGSGGSPLHRVRVAFDFAVSGRKELDGMIAGHAQAARALGEELGLADGVLDALGACYERWDGRGYPGDLSGLDVPLGVPDHPAGRVHGGRPPDRWHPRSPVGRPASIRQAVRSVDRGRGVPGRGEGVPRHRGRRVVGRRHRRRTRSGAPADARRSATRPWPPSAGSST